MPPNRRCLMLGRTLAAVILLCVMAGCDRRADGIVGKWRTAGDSSEMVWEFFRDSSVVMGSSRGKYTLGDGGRIKIQTQFGTSVYQMELSGDHLSLKDPRDSKLEFTRLK